MSESFIHYLWQYQYFNKYDLVTNDGEPVNIFHPGYRNSHAGPDFLDVRIRIGDMEWIGSVEIHIDASGWIHHRHDHDAAYDNVVLHVVWNNDKAVTRTDGSILPTLELKNRVEHDLLSMICCCAIKNWLVIRKRFHVHHHFGMLQGSQFSLHSIVH